MKWSVPIARVAGIPVRIHLSFLLAVIWAVGLGWHEGGWYSGVWAGALIVILFVCVVLHELGHSLVAIAFGSEVTSVTLYPIGGVAGLRSVPRQPAREILMAVAGPAVNGVIVIALASLRGGLPDWAGAAVFPNSAPELWDALIRANIILAGFNLLPAFPMDGGRILRALLAMRLPYVQATRTAAAIGQALAVGIILLGICATNPFLALIGVFVFLGAAMEERAAVTENVLKHLRVRDVMTHRFLCVHPDDSLADCMRLEQETKKGDFLVEYEGRVVGLLSSADLRDAMRAQGAHVPVAQAMRKVFVSVDAAAPMDRLYRDMSAMNQPIFPVIDQGRVVGVLTPELISRSLCEVSDRFAPDIMQAPMRVRNTHRFVVDLG